MEISPLSSLLSSFAHFSHLISISRRSPWTSTATGSAPHRQTRSTSNPADSRSFVIVRFDQNLICPTLVQGVVMRIAPTRCRDHQVFNAVIRRLADVFFYMRCKHEHAPGASASRTLVTKLLGSYKCSTTSTETTKSNCVPKLSTNVVVQGKQLEPTLGKHSPAPERCLTRRGRNHKLRIQDRRAASWRMRRSRIQRPVPELATPRDGVLRQARPARDSRGFVFA